MNIRRIGYIPNVPKKIAVANSINIKWSYDSTKCERLHWMPALQTEILPETYDCHKRDTNDTGYWCSLTKKIFQNIHSRNELYNQSNDRILSKDTHSQQLSLKYGNASSSLCFRVEFIQNFDKTPIFICWRMSSYFKAVYSECI